MKRTRGSNSQSSWLYGLNPIVEALRSDRAVHEILVLDSARIERLRELTSLARAKNISLRRVPRAELDQKAAHGVHQGIIARVAAARYADADDLLSFLGAQVGVSPEPLAAVLDGVEDPRNFGAILRTAECAGVQAVFISERRAVGLTDVVAKAAAGAVEHVPVARATNLTRLIEQLKERNIWVVGTADNARILHTEWDWTRPAAVVLGSEGSGLHRLVSEHCDTLVRIPVVGKIASLNVAVAAGVVFYEAMRQRIAAAKNQT